MADKRISVRLNENMQRQLDDEVVASGKKESDLVREALAAYLGKRSRPESCLELAQRHRLIGCAKRLPSDLSTNRKHFEGFGR